ncbi:MAG: pyridoxamine 5'-phosphate oxidase family protein [Rhizobiaceae bacterium]|nr:pyridoxamine 5'-phosphate oxidase family protein [Rhizobiaceae bacterium]
MNSNFTPDETYLVQSTAELRNLMGDTHQRIWDKSSSYLSPPMKRFIELSPFFCLATHDAAGNMDVSPRGDPAGFVNIQDERTLIIPDRPGNRRYDAMRNIFETGKVSLIFMIPGIPDTLRVNGTAQVTRQPDILNKFVLNNSIPDLALIISIKEAYGHCSKAIIRSGLWDADAQIERDQAPTLLDLMTGHKEAFQEDKTDVQTIIENDAKNNLY